MEMNLYTLPIERVVIAVETCCALCKILDSPQGRVVTGYIYITLSVCGVCDHFILQLKTYKERS